MSQQLIVSTNSTADSFRWCWLGEGETQASSGNLDALRAVVSSAAQQAWLLVPGVKVVTRELEYTEKEKKHLRSLLPFQLEESVAGDIDDLHVALGTASNGKVALAYTDREWLRGVFAKLAEVGLEITRCWSAPSVVPLGVPESASLSPEPVEPGISETNTEQLAAAPTVTWVLALEGNLVNVRYAQQQGFSVALPTAGLAVELLINEQGLKENLPLLVLRAASESELERLYQSLPELLRERVSARVPADSWALDLSGGAIDLCQAEFSQRLPLERWWKLWRSLAILAGVTFVVYLAVLLFDIYKLSKQNLVLRQQMEAVYRGVVPRGPSDDPEGKLRAKLANLQPKTQMGSVVSLLGGVLPVVASNPDITVKAISFAAETGELSVSAQSHSFSALDALRQTLIGQGYAVDPIIVNTQGDVNTGRLKISKPH